MQLVLPHQMPTMRSNISYTWASQEPQYRGHVALNRRTWCFTSIAVADDKTLQYQDHLGTKYQCQSVRTDWHCSSDTLAQSSGTLVTEVKNKKRKYLVVMNSILRVIIHMLMTLRTPLTEMI